MQVGCGSPVIMEVTLSIIIVVIVVAVIAVYFPCIFGTSHGN